MFCFSFLLTRPPWSTLFPYTNVSATWVFDSAEAGTGSDVEESLANSDVVVERTFRQQRLIPAFMEPRSTVVDPTGEQITMWSATQIPHILKLKIGRAHV